MLQAQPKKWYSWDFHIYQNAAEIAFIDVSCFRERAQLRIAESDFEIYREKIFGGEFIMKQKESTVVRAVKPSAFTRTFEIETKQGRYTLKPESTFKRKFILLHGDRQIGSVSPNGAFTRKATIDLPENMSLAEQVFIFWLVLIMWKRAAEATATRFQFLWRMNCRSKLHCGRF